MHECNNHIQHEGEAWGHRMWPGYTQVRYTPDCPAWGVLTVQASIILSYHMQGNITIILFP